MLPCSSLPLLRLVFCSHLASFLIELCILSYSPEPNCGQGSSKELAFPNAFPYNEDDLYLDGVDAVCSYLRLSLTCASKNLVALRFSGKSIVVDQVYIDTAATLSLMSTSSFKLGCTPRGAMYVNTGVETDAAMLDGQKFVCFRVQVSFHRVTDIMDEPAKASDDVAAFKLFKH